MIKDNPAIKIINELLNGDINIPINKTNLEILKKEIINLELKNIKKLYVINNLKKEIKHLNDFKDDIYKDKLVITLPPYELSKLNKMSKEDINYIITDFIYQALAEAIEVFDKEL